MGIVGSPTPHQIYTPALSAALGRHAHTLETLVLKESIQGFGTFYWQQALNGLQNFHKLQTLEIDESLLHGDSDDNDYWESASLLPKLPSTLTCLEIAIMGGLMGLGNVLKTCSEIEAPGLGRFVVAFSPHGIMADGSAALFSDSFTYGDRCWSVSKMNEGGEVRFTCEGQPVGPTLAALAVSIEEYGVEHLLRMQLPGYVDNE
ncbi:hypothetical protein LTR08_002036 [Meristemomyces frigidus]|nr:hypothetical protein LTR08_002036 [Meristemomyces frigidus]